MMMKYIIAVAIDSGIPFITGLWLIFGKTFNKISSDDKTKIPVWLKRHARKLGLLMLLSTIGLGISDVTSITRHEKREVLNVLKGKCDGYNKRCPITVDEDTKLINVTLNTAEPYTLTAFFVFDKDMDSDTRTYFQNQVRESLLKSMQSLPNFQNIPHGWVVYKSVYTMKNGLDRIEVEIAP